MTPDYTAATADVLTAATLAKPEAKKAAVRAVLESYFPATGEIQPHPDSMMAKCTALLIEPSGRVQLWEGRVYRGTFTDLDTAVSDIKRRAQA